MSSCVRSRAGAQPDGCRVEVASPAWFQPHVHAVVATRLQIVTAGKPDAPPVSPRPFRGAQQKRELSRLADDATSWLGPKASNPRCELLLGRPHDRMSEATEVPEQSAGR